MPLNCCPGEDSWNPLDSKEMKPANLKGDQHWIFTGRTEAEAEAPLFRSSDVNRRFIGKVPDAGKYWGQKEKRESEDEIAEQHHQCNEHELGQTLGDSEGQGGLVCCSPWAQKSWTQLDDWTTATRLLCITVCTFAHLKKRDDCLPCQVCLEN